MVGLLLFPLYSWTHWSWENWPNFLNVTYKVREPGIKPRAHKHCTLQLPKSSKLKPQSSKGGLPVQVAVQWPLSQQPPLTSWRLFSSHPDLGVHGRAVWISFQNNSHSLESPLAGPLTSVAPHPPRPAPPSHRYAVPFYYQTSLHLPILVSRIQKCRARITMHWLAFINNILQFPRPGAWINYSSASRLRWSKRWPGWPSSRGGIKRRLWLHQGARLRGGSESRASVLWLHDNQISENAWTLILRSCWRRDWCDKQVWRSHHSWGLTESLLITVHLVLFSCSLHWAPPHTQPQSHTYIYMRTYTRAHSLYTSCYSLNCVPQIHMLGVLIPRTSA